MASSTHDDLLHLGLDELRQRVEHPPGKYNPKGLDIAVAAPRIIELVERKVVATGIGNAAREFLRWAQEKRSRTTTPHIAQRLDVWDQLVIELTAIVETEIGFGIYNPVLTLSGPEPGIFMQWYAAKKEDLNFVHSAISDPHYWGHRSLDARLAEVSKRLDLLNVLDQGVLVNAAGRPIDPAPFTDWLSDREARWLIERDRP